MNPLRGGDRGHLWGHFSNLFYYFHKIQVVTMLFCSYYRHHLNQVVTPYLNTPRFLLCRICAIVTLAIHQNTVLTSGSAGADI